MVMFRALFGLVLAAIVTGQDLVEIEPKDAVVRIGDTFTVLCKVPYHINACRIRVGHLTYLLDDTKDTGDDVAYFGTGIHNGQCGARIKNVKEEWNGNISCQLPPQSGSIEVTKSMRLYVARAPADPDLLTPLQNNFREGEVFNAQCRVANGRPAAKIFWRLDDLPLETQYIHEPILVREPNSDLTTVTQNISYPLQADHNGRTLSCVAEHVGLDQPRQATRQINVLYPPKAEIDSSTITIFGLKLNEQGRLNVTVRSNPEPEVEWTTGAIKLVGGSETEEGRLRALQPVALGRGYYEVSLVIAQLEKEDVEREYKLVLKNGLGDLSRTVTISTLDEPAGVELSTGAIVGIVIAVLILLAAISLAVFARATDRWCFSGGRQREAKSSGESTPAGDVLIDSGIPLAVRTSDTESAGRGVGRGGRLAEFGARVRAALPRGKDKVATSDNTHDADDKPLSDEKKSVVYAELALGDQTNTEKPAPPSTEYAEIVYTDQQKQVKE